MRTKDSIPPVKSVRARRSQVQRAPLEPAPPAPDPDPSPSPRVRPKQRTEVIDLGAPRSPAGRRARRPYKPNPRLYPGPQARAGARPRPRPREPRARPPPRSAPPPRHRRRARLTLPSARLYRPPPPSPRRAPEPPHLAWLPPALPRVLDTASHAALRLAARRDPARVPTKLREKSPSLPPPSPAWSRHLVVTLPAAGDAGARPAAAGPPRLLSLDTDADSSPSTPRPAPAAPRAGMAAPPRHSASPEDRSDGNDPLSAPSEYLAEFLSAIMQRQYAEALKYCRLILQYEPHNATARGFYPLLRHKLGLARGRSARAPPRGSDSDDASRHSAAPPRDEEVMSHSADESGSEGSCASQSSLSLDSSERSGSGSRTAASASHSASAGSSSSARWHSDAASDEPDDNGNAPAPPTVSLAPRAPRPDDVENDNAGGGDHTARLKSESAASLRRLRAQFACEIK